MRNGTDSQTFIGYIRQNAFVITIQVAGALVLVLNLWLASKLTPLAQDIQLLKFQVSAVERQTSASTEKINSIDVLSSKLSSIDENIKEIKQTVIRLEDRIK